MTALFQKATRTKLRVLTNKGSLSVEQLWDLPLKTLDTVYMELNRTIKAAEGESLIEPKKADTEAVLACEIVKTIIITRQAENSAKLEATAKREEKAKLMALLGRKRDSAMEDLSEAEIEARIAAL